MTGKLTGSQADNEQAFVAGWSVVSSQRLKVAIKAFGSQGQVADRAQISRQSLTEILRFDGKGEAGSRPKYKTLRAVCEAIGVSPDAILAAENLGPAPSGAEIIAIPRLTAVASAGNGVSIDRETLEVSPFHLAGDWLRQKFGTVSSLRVVQVNGSSQEPDLRDGDWVLIDEAKNVVEDGLAVIRLDDGLLLKRLQRDGSLLHLLSKNPDYITTTIDLRQDEERLKVIGKVVYSFRAM
jgi:phage repressor protein C with HTH and peptisase S24 domain